MAGSGRQNLSLILYFDSTVQHVMREVSISEAWAATLGLDSTMRQRAEAEEAARKVVYPLILSFFPN